MNCIDESRYPMSYILDILRDAKKLIFDVDTSRRLADLLRCRGLVTDLFVTLELHLPQCVQQLALHISQQSLMRQRYCSPSSVKLIQLKSYKYLTILDVNWAELFDDTSDCAFSPRNISFAFSRLATTASWWPCATTLPVLRPTF